MFVFFLGYILGKCNLKLLLFYGKFYVFIKIDLLWENIIFLIKRDWYKIIKIERKLFLEIIENLIEYIFNIKMLE